MRPDAELLELSEVTDYLLLGGAAAVSIDNILRHGVTCVINVSQLPNLVSGQ